nr:hypothetical protein [Anaerolineae bacterium]
MLIKKETWDNYLDMLSEDESSAPVTVIVSRNRDGGVTAIKPDHVEVEYRDYKVGSDCGTLSQ